MDYTFLLDSPIFRGLMLAEIMSVISVTSYRIRKFRAGTIIYQSGDYVTSFVMVIGGAVKGEMIDFSGRIIKIEEVSSRVQLPRHLFLVPRTVFRLMWLQFRILSF